ncbi:cell envelope integrity protein CreD [Jannaschia sp. S6380]|uniref:cell envelope integrity protein CreD n=1 Tax=Jannaschia sp. S6380 TaxID=2926408 RepID=UPI001FF3480E|nr:cell envelope integrity protein CreD [Jannaschia sp. S6380]MCK0168136.1 cell envelope integrity protein CreD [Jannaschia sp. S6380]
MRSAGFRFLVVGLLTLLMFVPLFFAGSIVQERNFHAEQTRLSVGREWGGPQTLTGPYLVIPVEGDVTRQERRQRTDPATGEITVETVTLRERGRVSSVLLLPDMLRLGADTRTDIRRRGIFEVPVYSADIDIEMRFDLSRVEDALRSGERLLPAAAVLRLGLTGNAGLRGEARVAGPDGALELEPYGDAGAGGIQGATGALTGTADFTIALQLNGAQEILVVPVGRDNDVTMSGDWPDPGFTGAFLPDAHEVGPEGFAARWSVPHLARTLPQVSRGDGLVDANSAFGTAFVQVNDFYQKAWRAARYGILFIALTFLTVLLLDRKDRPTHPVQYILIGLAQSVFILLMVGYAEQVGFTPAYVGSAAATIGLLTLFGWIGLKLGTRTWVLGALLVVLYAVLYLILRSTDLALLAGATLAFAALTLTIILTRNEDWYGPDGPGRGFRRRPQPSQAKAASSAISTMSPKDD